MGPDTTPTSTLFTMKITPEARALALQALATEAPEYGEDRLREALSSASNRLSLDAGEAAVLASSLLSYAENELREGSRNHRTATEFASALGDVAVTVDEMTTRAAQELEESVEDAHAYQDEIAGRADDRCRRRLNEKRDDMLREVFTGGPRKRLNHWGQVVDDPDPLSKEELRRRAKTTHFDPFPYGSRIPANRSSNRVRTLEGVVDTTPTAITESLGVRVPTIVETVDEACDELTRISGGRDYNVDMKLEGARQLILDRNRGAS